MKKRQNGFAQKFESSIQNFFTEYKIPKNAKLIVAFSGGCDSLALLIALKKINCANVVPVYINHHLRDNKELEIEIEKNRANSKKLGLELVVLDVDSSRLDKLKGASGIEGAARSLRYELLESFASLSACEYILTAHNSTDCDEEDIIQFFRGAESFGSIPKKNANIYRPLLEFSHEDNEEYCKINNFDFSTDTTNFDNKHLRSKIRLSLIPQIEEVFPSFQNSFKTRRKIASQQGSLRQELFTALRAISINNSNNSRITLKDISSIMDFFANGSNTGKIEYCDAVVFRAKKGDYVVSKRCAFHLKWSHKLTSKDIESGFLDLENGDSFVICKSSESFSDNALSKLPENTVALARGCDITFRSSALDDELVICEKRIKLKDILKAAGVSSRIVNIIPTVEIDKKPVAFLLGCAGQKNKFSDYYKTILNSNKNGIYVFIRTSGPLS